MATRQELHGAIGLAMIGFKTEGQFAITLRHSGLQGDTAFPGTDRSAIWRLHRPSAYLGEGGFRSSEAYERQKKGCKRDEPFHS